MNDGQLEITKIESIILDNLDIILTNSESIQDIHDIIKEFTIDYIYEYHLFEEGFGSDVLKTFETTFWSNALTSWTGKFSMGNWLLGVGAKTVANKGFGLGNFATTGTSEVLKKFGIENLTSGIGLFLTKASFSLILPSILIGMVIYKLIRYKDIITIKNFEDMLLTCMVDLRLNSKHKELYKSLDKQLSRLLKNECVDVSDKKQKIECASNKYINLISKNFLVLIIKELVIKIKQDKLPLEHIVDFKDLCYYDFYTNKKMEKRFKELYILYNKCLDLYIVNNKDKIKLISLLDREVVNAIKSKS